MDTSLTWSSVANSARTRLLVLPDAAEPHDSVDLTTEEPVDCAS